MIKTTDETIAPSMTVRELKQKLADWYADNEYCEDSLSSALHIVDLLCDYIRKLPLQTN